jgi:hypothetical protein
MTLFWLLFAEKKPILEKLITFSQPKYNNIVIIIIIIIIILFLFKNARTQKGPASY